jgi:succinylglutamate desuccinylase
MNVGIVETPVVPAVGEHVVARFGGDRRGPLVVAVAGIHGNEPAGVAAMHRVAAEIRASVASVRGEVLFLAGNTRALVAGTRYIDVDLNRIWTAERLDTIGAPTPLAVTASEDLEVTELREVLGALADTEYDGRYFVDLHTMSAAGGPFATVGDSLDNREFASNFHLPKILGLEENIDGSLLEYMNQLGFVTTGFEAGQHASPISVTIHEAVLRVALVAAGCLDRQAVPELEASSRLLEETGGDGRFFEVRHRHPVRPGDEFSMAPGFRNFDPVYRGQILAHDWRGPIRAQESGVVMLPLYQGLGDDGFFIGRQFRPVWLRVSTVLRRSRIERVLPLLPGVRRQVGTPSTLVLNTRTARFFPLQILHLLGYRKLRWVDDLLVVARRR